MYAMNKEGCFLMDFIFQGKKLVMHATRKYQSIARLVNHSRIPNIKFHSPIVTDQDGDEPSARLAAYAVWDIFLGEEILFDYAVKDRNIDSKIMFFFFFGPIFTLEKMFLPISLSFF